MLKYKILIKLYVLIFVLIRPVYGDTIQVEVVVVLCLLFAQPADKTRVWTGVTWPRTIQWVGCCECVQEH